MKYRFGKTIVIALGGSIMYPEAIDSRFLKNFRAFILKRVRPPTGGGTRFIIITGGGRTARIYQEAAEKIACISDEDKDWLGIHATRANAHLLRTILRDVANPVIVDSREKMNGLRYPVTIASGWRPGWSTDYIAIAIAAHFKVKEVVVAGKPSFVYDKDHQKHANAKPLPELLWTAYQRLIPRKWKPGLHTPVDPVAAELARKRKIKAVIVNGRDLENFSKLLDGKNFNGTVIS
ncbi:MAG: UMP kinase [Candidatus Liptonbacteria bacterium]|nr:UMP kinase [Candidatus Liptonbacteria bacterium]